MARRPLVMGNWKLNGSKVFTKELVAGLKAELADVKGCDVAIAPPVMYLAEAEAILAGQSVITLGAQNVDVNVQGASSVTLNVVLTTKKAMNSLRKNSVH